jgi:hypothetical protein
MNEFHFLALIIVFIGTFVTLGHWAESRSRIGRVPSEADRTRAIQSELRLVR